MPVMPDEDAHAEAEEDDRRIHQVAGQVQAALDLVGAGPAAVAATAGDGAVRAADRVVAAVVQRVVRDVVLGDVAPDVLLAPVGQRRALELAGMAVVAARAWACRPALGDWSRRRPVIQASTSLSARSSGSTLRMPQQASGSRCCLSPIAPG